MELNLNTIRSLDANKTYYIANSTGQIKEAGAWQKFKCFLGVGDARDKVQKLVDGVKVALLKASGESDNAALSAAIEEYEENHNWLFSASGGSLAGIASRFAVANADKIASASAGEIAGKAITALVKDTVRPCLRREDWPADAVRYLERAAKPLVEHPPTKDAGGGRRVLDEAAFEAQLKALLDDASTDLVHVASSERLGMPRFDKVYLDHVFATFYDENGVRNDKTEADLRPALDVRLEKGRAEAGDRPSNIDERHYSALVHVAIEACGKDVDVLDRVFRSMRRILVNDGGQARSPVAVRQYVAGIKGNFEEMREAAKGNKAVLRAGLLALGGLGGKPLPPGMIAKIAELAHSVELKHAGKLGPSSEGYDIHKAMMELYAAFHSILFDQGLIRQADGQDDLSPARILAFAFLLDRFPPDVLRHVDAALETPQAARLQQVYFDMSVRQQDIPDEGVPGSVISMVSNQGGSMNNAMGSLKHAVDAMLGLKNKPIGGKGEQLAYEDVGGDKIFFDLKSRMETVAKADREVFLATRAVKGNGPAAGRVRELVSAQIEEFPLNPDKVMGERYTSVIRPLHSLAALSDAKKVAKGLLKDTGFAKAIADGKLEVQIKGGGKLSSDPDEALDQLARHVAGREDATFATLDPMARRKVALIAGALGDKAMKAISDGVGIALDPEGGKSALTIAGGGEKRRVELDCKGGKLLRMQIETERTGVNARMGSASYLLGPGSMVKTRYDFELGIDQMVKFEKNVDLDAFDGTAAEEIASAPGSVPDRAERVKEILGAKHMLGFYTNAVNVDFILN